MTDDFQPQHDGDPIVTDTPLGSESAAMTPPIDTVFELLADDDRRLICLYLMRAAGAVVTLDEIADALADEGERERFAIDLHHRHLPKLAAAGLIEYDARSHTARYWGQPTVEKWAEHVRAMDNRTEQSAP
jgi:hypothetical protein